MKRLLQLAVLPLFIGTLWVVPARAQSADGANPVEKGRLDRGFDRDHRKFGELGALRFVEAPG